MRFFLIFMAFALTGCLTEETKSRDWYINHPEEMATKVDDCKNHAEKMQEADCLNALQAEEEIRIRELKELEAKIRARAKW
ncbi:EexN family lipoprotein [Vibrio fluminensis]|uniref:EexN family lipoprotein n=1 Tax=Vibrio fluminensis TaxID=2783614 RepID=UPI001889B5DF|nr:EexN family lipoprotein [Vibrio fluminensis]